MKEYFQTKVGQKIVAKVKTGKTFFTDVFQRNYVIEILSVSRAAKNPKMTVAVSSYDVVPTGYKQSGTDKYYKEFEVKIFSSRDKTIEEIICRADFAFLLANKFNGDMLQITG
ncbi:MAG: hypothetical protein K0R18_326 [Bacillales bacterium]|nr:hypothetical protein [Bacillales bacterium]